MNVPLVLGSEAPLVNATRFRVAHEADWLRLEEIVSCMEKRSIHAIADEDLLDLPRLYRTTMSSLSVARDTSLDRALIFYLEQLCTRAYFQIYGVQTSAGRQLANFFVRGWPSAVRQVWRETLLCALLMFGAAIAAYMLVRSEPSWFYGIIPQGLSSGRDPAASAEFLRSTLYDKGDGLLMTFATFLFTNNSQIAIFSFALGFAFAVPTILLVIYNGLMLGAFFAVFAGKGLTYNLAGWLMIHGTTELFAIAIAAGAGVKIGTAVAFPGRWSRMDAAVQAGRPAATAMAGAVIMLFVAGILEGVGRQSITNDLARFGIGSAMLLLWIGYFYLWRAPGGSDVR